MWTKHHGRKSKRWWVASYGTCNQASQNLGSSGYCWCKVLSHVCVQCTRDLVSTRNPRKEFRFAKSLYILSHSITYWGHVLSCRKVALRSLDRNGYTTGSSRDATYCCSLCLPLLHAHHYVHCWSCIVLPDPHCRTSHLGVFICVITKAQTKQIHHWRQHGANLVSRNLSVCSSLQMYGVS